MLKTYHFKLTVRAISKTANSANIIGQDSRDVQQMVQRSSNGRTLSVASMLYFAAVFFIFFMAALVGQTAERIFTKLSHVVDIRCYL